MTGENLALGMVAALALLGSSRRGSASADPWQRLLGLIEQSPVVVAVTDSPHGWVRIESEGAYMNLAPKWPGSVFLDYIKSSERGGGRGTSLLEVLTAAADRTNTEIELVADTERLCRYYRRHGFELWGSDQECEDLTEMIRYPRRGSAARFTVRSPAEGYNLIAGQVYTDNWRKALKHPRRHKVAVLVPCAGTKPFSQAPSHKHGYMPALDGLKVDRWVVAEPLGVVPWSWQDTYPNNAYDFPPDQLRGQGRALLVERIRDWLKGPGAHYRHILLALPGHHGKLVRDAAEGLSLPMEDLSISACRADGSCASNVHRATSEQYRRWLRRRVKEMLR